MVTPLRRRRAVAAAGEEEEEEEEEEQEPSAPPWPAPPPRARGAAPDDDDEPPTTARLLPGAIRRVLRDAFFPTSVDVPPDYAPFVYWNAIQGLSSYVRGVLSSAAVFASLGVGDGASTPLAAATLTAARDCAGTLGGIVFAWRQGANFEASAKQWRLFADVLNDVAMALDLASPLLVRRLGAAGFLVVASLAALARALVSVAAGATGAALTHHFARGGRGAAELSAKADSRERAASIVGTLAGVGLARLVNRGGGSGASPLSSWLLFAALTWLHVWANVRAMRCLVLDSLTPARLELLLLLPPPLQQPTPRRRLPTPEQAAALETLLPPPLRRAARRLLRAVCGGGRAPRRVRFGAPLGELLEAERRRLERAAGAAGKAAAVSVAPASVLAALRRRSASRDYLVAVAAAAAARAAAAGGGGGGDVLVAVRRGAGAEARLRAYAHALRLANDRGDDDGGGEQRAEERAARWAKDEFAPWLRAAREAGWAAAEGALLPRLEAEGEW